MCSFGQYIKKNFFESDINIKKLEEVNLIQLNKGKIVIMKSQYMIMKKELEYYVNGENVF